RLRNGTRRCVTARLETAYFRLVSVPRPFQDAHMSQHVGFGVPIAAGPIPRADRATPDSAFAPRHGEFHMRTATRRIPHAHRDTADSTCCRRSATPCRRCPVALHTGYGRFSPGIPVTA